MAFFVIDYKQTEYRRCYVEAESAEAARAAFDEDGPSDDDHFQTAEDQEILELAFQCPTDGEIVLPGESCGGCGAVYGTAPELGDEPACRDCGRPCETPKDGEGFHAYHADTCHEIETLSQP